jgi:hypothetical protein
VRTNNSSSNYVASKSSRLTKPVANGNKVVSNGGKNINPRTNSLHLQRSKRISSVVKNNEPPVTHQSMAPSNQSSVNMKKNDGRPPLQRPR